MKKYVLLFAFLVFPNILYADFIPNTPEKVEKLVMAIYHAEGAEKSSFPFGIKSIKCKNYIECKQICINTVVNNIKRWEKAKEKGYKEDYLTFLWYRYCPPNAHYLNKHWFHNVKYFLNKE